MVRVVVANTEPEDVALVFQRAGLSGTIVRSLGFGDWGIEPGVSVELAAQDARAVDVATLSVLRAGREQSAYVRTDEGAYLLKRDGTRETLEGA